MTYRLTADRAAAVSTTFHWIKVGPDTPKGAKVQLIDRARSGVAVYGHYTDKSDWTHWQALPTFAPDDKKEN